MIIYKKTRIMRYLWWILLWCAVLTASKSLRAQGIATPRNDINVDMNAFRDVASDLRCPTCTGLSVLDSDATFSIQIKNEVKEQLAAGKNKDEILNFFTARYGPWILRAPPKSGVNLLAWGIPILALILGPILIWIFVWTRRGNEDTAANQKSMEAIVAEMRQRLEAMRADAPRLNRSHKESEP